MVTTTFVERLREAIAGRPVDRVARRAGVHRITLRNMLAGKLKRGAFSETIEALAQELEVEPGWLAYGRGPKEAQRADAA